jgi:hypothetical protein
MCDVSERILFETLKRLLFSSGGQRAACSGGGARRRRRRQCVRDIQKNQLCRPLRAARDAEIVYMMFIAYFARHSIPCIVFLMAVGSRSRWDGKPLAAAICIKLHY